MSARVSGDGETWTEPNRIELEGLPEAVSVGLFAAETGRDGKREHAVATVCDLRLTPLVAE